ncbi:MAG TPA: acetylxylan esterase [Planctomycetota bacterium]|nr:acetylxylan esterase [Planctomycetota bacterium]
MPAPEVFPRNATPPDAHGFPDYRRFAAADRAWARAHERELRGRRRRRRSAEALRADLARCLGLRLTRGAPASAMRVGRGLVRVPGAGWDGADIVLRLTHPAGAPRGVALVLSGDALRATLARAGFIVAVVDLPALRALSMAHNKRRVIEGSCALGDVVAEAAIAIGAVAQVHALAPWVVGTDAAATAAILLAALDGRVAGVIATTPIELGEAAPYALAIPGIAHVADLTAIAATIAPRPVVIDQPQAALLRALARATRPATTAVRFPVPLPPRPRADPATSSRSLPAWAAAAKRLSAAFVRLNAMPASAARCRPLAVRRVGTSRLADATREEIDVRTGAHTWAKLAFLRPLGPERRRPTVLCLPGSGDDVARVESRYAHEVVARGWNAAIIDARVALHPFYPCIGEGRPALGQSLDDLRRVLTVVAARSDVDRRRIATFGVSQGGTHAWMLAAFDRRIAAAAPVCGLTTWTSLFDAPGPGGGSALDGHSPYYYFPGILAHGDQPDLCALMAPRPLMMIGATRDPWFPLDGMRATARAIRRVYALHRRADAFRYLEFTGGHSLPQPIRERAYDFLDEAFAAV